MRAYCVMGHQLLGDLFCERRFKPASDVDGRQLLMLAPVVRFEFCALKVEFCLFAVCL
jgi:hypothetical protein